MVFVVSKLNFFIYKLWSWYNKNNSRYVLLCFIILVENILILSLILHKYKICTISYTSQIFALSWSDFNFFIIQDTLREVLNKIKTMPSQGSGARIALQYIFWHCMKKHATVACA